MNKIVEHYYEVSTNKIENTRIVLLSDIHYYEKKDLYKLEKLTEHLLKLKPDYITIVGDLLDEAFVFDLEYLYDWIKNTSKYVSIIISIGNHDLLIDENFETGFNKEFFQKLKKIPKVEVVDDNTYQENDICFLGLTLPAAYYYQEKEPKDQLIAHMNSTFPVVDKNKFHVLLCHTPLMIAKKDVLEQLKIKKQLDLILCGHTHGGITPEFLKPILKGIGLISPFRTLFFKYAYGYIKRENTNVIISSGVTKASHRNRFRKLDSLFAREITVIDIKNIK